MREQEIRAALDRNWAASDASDFEAEHSIYREDAVLEYPQSGERTRGRRNIQITRAKQPSKKRFAVRRIIGSGNLWVTEYILTYDGKPSYTVSIMEFSDGKLHGKHSILRILSRRAPGVLNGSNGWTHNHETQPSVPSDPVRLVGWHFCPLVSTKLHSIKRVSSRTTSGMICTTLYAEPADSPDVGQALLKCREAAFLGAAKSSAILRAPRIISSFDSCPNANDADANSQREQQEPHGRLPGPSAINATLMFISSFGATRRGEPKRISPSRRS